MDEKKEVEANIDSYDNAEACAPLTNSKTVHVGVENSGSSISQDLVVKLLLATVVVTAAISTGMALGHSAVLLPQLKSDNGTLHADDELGSWIASLPITATPIGSIVGGILLDSIGRKVTLQIRSAVAITAWVFITVCENHAILLVGRFILGFATGLGLAANMIYIAEVSDPNMRIVFSSMPMASTSLGILIIYALGSSVNWRIASGLAAIPTAISALILFFLPETPVWLVRHGQLDKAEKASLWLRGNNTIKAKQDIQQLIIRTDNEKRQIEQSQSTWKSMSTRQVLKPFIIINIFIVLQTFAGVNLIIFYAVDVISLMGSEDINNFFVAVLTAGVRFVFSLFATFLLAFVRRRTVGIGSALGTGVSSLFLSMLLYSDCRSNSYFYFATTCLLLYVAANTSGMSVLPNVMIGEMFPARARGLAGTLAYINFSLITFGVAKLFPFFKRTLGIHGFFLLFGISSLLASLFIYLTVPETKDKSLNEIEDYFSKDNILWVTRNNKIKKSNNIKI